MILDALVQTSLSEGLPNAVLEAMAMDVPVVATAAGGTSEIVRHRETGWLTEIGEARGLCEGLEHVRNDPEESRLWACRARTMVEHDFSLARMVENFCDLYDRVAGLHP
jgi:glycosyltransferase involved in cell wall biosynthesis